MQTKKYAPAILALLAAVLAIIHLAKYFSDAEWGKQVYLLIAGGLFAGAALTSFVKNANMKIGWYLYLAAFAFWIITQFINTDIVANIVPILSDVLIGLFIIVYLLDDEVIASFSYEFQINK